MISAVGVLRDNSPAALAGIIGNFDGPDLVPLLPHHHSGDVVGWLQGVLERGSDVWFIAHVTDDAMAERLRRGPVDVSLELSGDRTVRVPANFTGQVLPGGVWGFPHYRGRLGPGWTLTGVAILREGEPPGAKGSGMWPFEPDAP